MVFDLFTFFSTAFTLSSSLVLAIFGFYTFFLLVYSRKKVYRGQNSTTPYNPEVSIILPAFKEGKYLRKKIANLLETNYDKSKIEIIVVFDSPDVSETEELSILAKKHQNIVIDGSKKRRGYSRALLDGIEVASGEIIIITDCGSYFEKTTIPELIFPLEDAKIGGVTGAAHILNQNEETGKSESFYRRIYNFMRRSESNADSTFHFQGEISAVRKDLLIGLPNFDNLDIAIAFHIRKQGQRVYFNNKAVFYEYAPRKYRERYNQKLARATGVMKVILGNFRMFSPQYGLFGTIIYPAHFLMMVICPLLIAFSGLSYSFILILDLPKNIIPIILSSITLTVSVIIKKELIINFLQFEFVLLHAIWKTLTDRSSIAYIDLIKSTRR